MEQKLGKINMCTKEEKKYLFQVFSLACILFFIDRMTKYYAVYLYRVYGISYYMITSFLSFSLSFNRGMSFSIGHSQDQGAFVLITGIAISLTLFVIYYAYDQFKSGYSILGELLVVIGSLSNIIDRFLYVGVVDFIEFSWNSWFWPAFNCADAYIVIGVGVILITMNREARKRSQEMVIED